MGVPIRDGMQGMSLRGHMEGGGSKLATRAVEEEVGAFEDNGRAEREVVVPGEASREVIEDGQACDSD